MFFSKTTVTTATNYVRYKSTMKSLGRLRLVDRSVLVLTSAIMILFGFAYRGLLTQQAFAFGDLGLFPSTANQPIQMFLSPWNPLSLGHYEPASPLHLLMASSILLFGADLSQKLALLLPGPVSAFTMFFLTRQLTRHAVSRIVTGVMYGTSIWIFAEIVGGGWTLMWIYALSPLVIAMWVRIQRNNSLREFSLMLGLSGLLYSIHPHSAFIVGPFVIGLFLAFLITKKEQRLRLFIQFGGWILVSLVFYLPYFDSASYFLFLGNTAASPIGASGFKGLDVGFISTYKSLASLFDVITLHYVMFPLAFIAVLFCRNEKRLIATVLSAIALGSVLFVWLTANGYTVGLFERFTILFAFENPVKPMAIMFLATIPLVGITIDRAYEALTCVWVRVASLRVISLRPWLPRLLVSLILSITLMSAFLVPVTKYIETGDVALNVSRGTTFIVPNDFQAVANWINQRRDNEGFFRTLWLPQTNDVMIPALTIDPHSFGLAGGSDRFGLPSVEYVRFVLTHLVSGDTNQTSYLLGLASVKYSFVDTLSPQVGPPSIVQDSASYIVTGRPTDFVKLLAADVGMQPVGQMGRFLVYKNNNFLPRFSTRLQTHVFRPFNESIAWQDTENILFNFDSTNPIKDWQSYTQKEVTVSNNTFVSPSNSIKLENSRAGGRADGWVSLSKTLPVHGGDHYRISYWIKTRNVQDSLVKAVFYPQMNTTSENNSIFQIAFAPAISGTTDWKQVTGYVRVPPAASRMDLVALGGWAEDPSSPADTWLDSISVGKGSLRVLPLDSAYPVAFVHEGSYSEPTKFTLLVNARSPITVVYAESFDQRWKAVIAENRQELPHLVADGWANAFIINEPGNWTIQIDLSSQGDRNISVMVWIALWIFLATLALGESGIFYRATRRIMQ